MSTQRSKSGMDHLHPREEDRELFDRELRSFVPPGSFDAHAHFYRLSDLDQDGGSGNVGLTAYNQLTAEWMGDRTPSAGLFFPLPTPNVDFDATNDLLVGEVRQSSAKRNSSRGLLLIHPNDDPALVEARVREATPEVVGFKIYHVYADRQDTQQASIDEFLPRWAWELADRHGLVLMLHMVRSRALADISNQQVIRRSCIEFPNAKLILAHAARGFCAQHTVEGIASLRGLDNVFFDTSVICEPGAFQAILREFGPRRLFYGSDFPVSNIVGRAMSVGDGFFWLYEDNVEWSGGKNGERTLVGIESLLALRQACRLLFLKDSDVEKIFIENARRELEIALPPPAEDCQSLYERAKRVIPGGTQLLSKRPEMFAPQRWPAYFAEARGVEVIDTQGRRFIDMSTLGLGACMFGYGDPDVNEAVARRVMLGSASTLNCREEVELAELLIELHPWADMARFARAGGEALAVAVRIARAHTNRDKIAFCGYHGWQDWYISANLGPAGQQGALDGHLLPGLSPAGVPRALAGTAFPFEYNDLESFKALVAGQGDDLAAILMEPTRHFDPEPGFLEEIREFATSRGVVLIFDEVSVGWRLHLGGAHLLYGVTPDMAVFSKATGNGYPIAAVIGIRSVMGAAQKSFISSTMWTEAVGPTAALATIQKMRRVDLPSFTARIGKRYADGIERLARDNNVPLRVSGHPCMVGLAFETDDAGALQTLLTARMVERGFLLASGFNASFAHEDRHVDACLAAAEEVFVELGEAVQAGDAKKRLGTPVKHDGFRRLA